MLIGLLHLLLLLFATLGQVEPLLLEALNDLLVFVLLGELNFGCFKLIHYNFFTLVQQFIRFLVLLSFFGHDLFHQVVEDTVVLAILQDFLLLVFSYPADFVSDSWICAALVELLDLLGWLPASQGESSLGSFLVLSGFEVQGLQLFLSCALGLLFYTRLAGRFKELLWICDTLWVLLVSVLAWILEVLPPVSILRLLWLFTLFERSSFFSMDSLAMLAHVGRSHQSAAVVAKLIFFSIV